MNIPKNELIKILNGDNAVIEKYRLLVIPNKTCKFCGDYFVPSSRSDEIYCENCRGIGYDVKVIRTGEVKSANCRREYKRLYAHYLRGKITKAELDKKFNDYKNKEN